ncbi:MAG: thermonuclease family protein [Planctomycetaceae bacterium]|nr:thermonuclease family protein [Planctomycetaceae bacterium]
MPQSTPTNLSKRRILATTTALLLLAGLVLAAEPVKPKVVEEFSGKVVGVTDGDTIKVLVNRKTVTVRLEGIDAPELGQSFGRKAKEALAKFVTGKIVTVKKTGNDKYGRTLVIVIVDGTDVNARLVEDGWAWHYKMYNSDERLAKLEVAAREAKRGLWADEAPLAPWDFRARQQALLAVPDEVKSQYWLNTSSGVRHNRSCEWFQKTKRGRFCGPNEGKPCGICGG